MAADEQRAPLPQDPMVCRQNAERSLGEWLVCDQENGPHHAVAWALLAVAGELAEIRRELRRKR